MDHYRFQGSIIVLNTCLFVFFVCLFFYSDEPI